MTPKILESVSSVPISQISNVFLLTENTWLLQYLPPIREPWESLRIYFWSKHQLMRSSSLPQKLCSEKHNLVFEDLGYHHYAASKRYFLANHRSSLVFLNLRITPWEFTLTLSAVSKKICHFSRSTQFNKGIIFAVMQL